MILLFSIYVIIQNPAAQHRGQSAVSALRQQTNYPRVLRSEQLSIYNNYVSKFMKIKLFHL